MLRSPPRGCRKRSPASRVCRPRHHASAGGREPARGAGCATPPPHHPQPPGRRTGTGGNDAARGTDPPGRRPPPAGWTDPAPSPARDARCRLVPERSPRRPRCEVMHHPPPGRPVEETAPGRRGEVRRRPDRFGTSDGCPSSITRAILRFSWDAWGQSSGPYCFGSIGYLPAGGCNRPPYVQTRSHRVGASGGAWPASRAPEERRAGPGRRNGPFFASPSHRTPPMVAGRPPVLAAVGASIS